ncbi:MAG: flagellar biosynthetic protein FliR [Spirochaetota bacterium]
MNLFELVADSQVFFLLFARVIIITFTAPLLGSQAIPGIAKVGLSLMTAYVVFPWASADLYPIPETGLGYAALLVGEGLIGLIIGLFTTLIFAAFQTAGQFFSLQMGFGASQVFDPLSQVEIPLLGQYFNLVAMFVFIATDSFNRLFFIGVYRSFQAVRAIDVLTQTEAVASLMMSSLAGMFQTALIISLPVLGTLVVVNISLGLMAKAAPQMNLLMLGFPVSILTAFLFILLALPVLVGAFDAVIEAGWEGLMRLFTVYAGARS